MTYRMKISTNLFKELVNIKQQTEVGIQQQILCAIHDYIDDAKKQIASAKYYALMKKYAVNGNVATVYNSKADQFDPVPPRSVGAYQQHSTQDDEIILRQNFRNPVMVWV